MADRSITYLREIVEDVLVKVYKFIFPVDFITLDMEEDRARMGWIAGRSSGWRELAGAPTPARYALSRTIWVLFAPRSALFLVRDGVPMVLLARGDIADSKACWKED